ncbi:hypothetical protein Tco_1561403 [Tanacetum coccineum]
MLTISINVYDSLVEPKKEMMMANSSQPREGTAVILHTCAGDDEDSGEKSGWTVDYPVLRYRLEVVVADDTAQTVVMFNEIATELLNCLPTAIRNLIGTTHVMDLKSHTYYEYGSYSFTYWKINLADLVDGEASSRNQLIIFNDSEPSFKRLSRQPSMCTPSKPNEEKRKERTELEDSDTDEVLCLAKDPHEINADGPVNKKKMKMRIDEDSNSV